LYYYDDGENSKTLATILKQWCASYVKVANAFNITTATIYVSEEHDRYDGKKTVRSSCIRCQQQSDFAFRPQAQPAHLAEARV
jgi:hypothetical protein